MRIFCDISVPHAFAKWIRILRTGKLKHHTGQIKIDLHKDHFRQNTEDIDWITEIGEWRPKPIVFTYDGKILSRRQEFEALRSKDLTVLDFKNWSTLDFNTQMAKVAQYWKRITEKLDKTSKPTVYYITQNGKIENLGATARYRK